METYQQTTAEGYFAAAFGLGCTRNDIRRWEQEWVGKKALSLILAIITWLLFARKSPLWSANKINFYGQADGKETLLMIYSPWHTLINCFNSIIYMLTLKRTRCPPTGPFFRHFSC